jgi:hypothetical protein
MKDLVAEQTANLPLWYHLVVTSFQGLGATTWVGEKK